MRAPLIEFEGLTVRRGGRNILEDVDLNISMGENVAILGPNGAGKSSLIKLMTREYRPVPREGMTYRLLGRDRWDLFDLRGNLGIVGYELEASLRRCMPVRELVLSGFFSSAGVFRNHAVTPSMMERAEASMEFLGISRIEGLSTENLSAGEMRRALIARAMVNDPGTYVLDEPMNSLDLVGRRALAKAISDLQSSGRGIVMVTHDLQDITPGFDRVVMVKGGRVLNDGAKDELLDSEHMSELFELDVHVVRDGDRYLAWAL